MSIIVDALERVQSDRHIERKYESGAFEVVDEQEHYENNENTGKPYTRVIVGSLIFILCFNVFWIYKKSNQDKMPFSEDFEELSTVSELATVNETGLDQNIGQIPLEESEEVDADFLSAFDIEEIASVEPTKNLTQEPKIEEKPPNISPLWLTTGKEIFSNQGLKQAIVSWEKGFITLDSNTSIISIMINRVPKLASDALEKLHENKIDAFSVQGIFKGKPAYFTLALSPKESAVDMMLNIEQLTKEKPFKSTQSFVQERVEQLKNFVPPIKKAAKKIQQTPKSTPKIVETVKTEKIKKTIISKKLSDKKRLLLGQEAVINGDYRDAILKLRPVLFNTKANWEVLFWIGSAKLGLGLYNEADDYFKNALTLNAEMPQLWTQRAVIAQEKNNHIAALKFLHKAQTLSPNAPEIILNIAYSNDALGDRNGAVYAYREFLSTTRGNTQFAQQRQAVNFRLEELGF